MAVLDNPSVTVFVREEVRPLCEALRALVVRIDAMKTEYNALINAGGSPFNSAADGDTIAEHREVEGVNDLTKLQITQAIGQFDIVTTTINDEIVQIPCVRSLQVS